MDRKKLIPIIAAGIIVILVIALIVIFIPPGVKLTPDTRKAIILSSANDYYRRDGEPDFNDGEDAIFDSEPFPPKWMGNYRNNSYGGIDPSKPDHETPGFIQISVYSPANPKYVNAEFVYNWTKYYPLLKFAAYNLSAWVNITTNVWAPTTIVPPGTGARIGLRWLNSTNDIVREDWSKGLFDTFTGWTFLNVTAIADNSSLTEITQLHLVLAVEGNMTGTDMVLFDDIRVERWFPPPIPIPIPSNTDADGFPAQALQVYWVLKNHRYTDDNIFLMLYHTGDNVIDISVGGKTNDLVGAIIDVENDDVNSSRFKQELNVSVSGSFASGIKSNEQLIIFMTDHGSNTVLGDGNATFHFEADDSYISEMEFYNLVKLINVERMLINIGSCFSGNFLNQDPNIGLSWYNIPNSILITSCSDNLGWSWRDIYNGDGFAGSWFFHHFWDQLNQSQTVGTAFNKAKIVIPSGQVNSVNVIQAPLIQDNLGIKDTWSFNNSNPQL